MLTDTKKEILAHQSVRRARDAKIKTGRTCSNLHNFGTVTVEFAVIVSKKVGMNPIMPVPKRISPNLSCTPTAASEVRGKDRKTDAVAE
eukprot:PDM65491.1 hypothetical protein PRIPAC_52433 [Pristionchus pacificus]